MTDTLATRSPRRRRRSLVIGGAVLLSLLAATLWQRANPHVLTSSITIDAPPETVWQILTDFDAYSEWNPSLLGMSGEPVVGERLSFRTAEDGLDVEPTLLVVAPGEELRWEGSLMIVGLFDGEHRFLLTELPDGGTHLIQDERFRGVLIPFMASWLDDNTLPEFEAMNEALKERAETS